MKILSSWFIFVLQLKLRLLVGSRQQQLALVVLHAKDPGEEDAPRSGMTLSDTQGDSKSWLACSVLQSP